MAFCKFHSLWFFWLTKDFFPPTLPWKSFFLNSLWTVSGLTLLCKWFSISAASFVALNFVLFWTLYLLTWRIWWVLNNANKGQMGFNLAFKGLIYLKIHLSSHALKIFLALFLTTSKPVYLFIPLINMLKSKMASLDNFGYFPQRFSVDKMINYQLMFLHCFLSTPS